MCSNSSNYDYENQNSSLIMELENEEWKMSPNTLMNKEKQNLEEVFKNGLSTNEKEDINSSESEEKLYFNSTEESERNKRENDENKKNSTTIKIQKTYNEKKERRNKKQIFMINESGYYNNQKTNERTKIGNNVEKKGKRRDNMKNEIKRNFFEDIIRNWINFKENLCLEKISPREIQKIDIYDYKDKTLRDIYELPLIKKQKDENYNKNIINKSKCYQKIKLGFTIKEAFLVFHNETSEIREKILENRCPEFLQKDENERKKNISEFYKGLIDFKEYSNKKNASKIWKNKFGTVAKSLADKLNEKSS